MNRPRYKNAQNGVMTYALDRAFYRAVDDDAVKVIVLAGEGYMARLPKLRRRVIPATSHIVITEPLPDDLFDRMIAARKQAAQLGQRRGRARRRALRRRRGGAGTRPARSRRGPPMVRRRPRAAR